MDNTDIRTCPKDRFKDFAYMEFKNNKVTKRLRTPTCGNGQVAAILVSIHQTKPIFELGREIDKRNADMKLGRIQAINNIKCQQDQTCMWQPSY